MLLIDILRSAVVNGTDLGKAKLSLPINTSGAKKCVVGDIVNKPEKFKLEAYIEGNEVVMHIKPKKGKIVDVEPKDSE